MVFFLPEQASQLCPMRIAYHRSRKEFDREAALIEALPASGIDKDEQLAVLYDHQEKFQEARRLWESQILRSTVRIQTALTGLVDIALKQGQEQDARALAAILEQVLTQLSVNRWVPYIAKLHLATRLQDRAGCLDALQKILPALDELWATGDSPLYRTVGSGNPEGIAVITRQLRTRLLHDLEQDAEFAFFRSSPEYEQLRPLMEHPNH